MDSNFYSNGPLEFKVSEKKLQNSNQNLNRNPKTIGSGSAAKKRQRTVDISKFNRSNRKSKNCAIFYFKHLDTDNENFGLSSQGSDALKSGDPSSDDEGWFFSNDCIDGKNTLTDDSDKENKETTNSSGEIQITSTNVISMDEIISKDDDIAAAVVAADVIDSLLFNGVVANEERECPLRFGLNHSQGEIDVKTVTVTTGYNKSPGDSCLEMAELANKECIQESIKQLVLDAEILVRDEVLKTPTKRHSIVKISSTVKKRETVMSGPNLQKVQEWLEHQPVNQKDEAIAALSQPTTDCEASGENTESDSAARESDSSEGFTDSIATCMQTGSNSQCTSTEIIGGSAEPIPNCGSNLSLGCTKVVRRTNKRSSDRPWSVSCLSQLTESDTISPDKMKTNPGLATHSISESALHILSSPGRRKDSTQTTPVKSADSKGSLKRRKTRRRKAMGKRSDSGSDGLLQKLLEPQAITNNIIEDLTMALSMMSVPKSKKSGGKSTSEMESEEEHALLKPNFKIGLSTTTFNGNESKLGSLAALANYRHEEQGEYNTGTEDHSSFSEQAWDNYQEKYNSENYSEGFDSDAARRLLEFGDDYRTFLDSQSDNCSSLSAANNFDSLSPPRMDSLNAAENKLPQQPVPSTVDHIRRRRTLELEYERRKKSIELKKKSSHDDIRSNRSPNGSSSSIHNSSQKSYDKNGNRTPADVAKKLDFGMNNSVQNLRKTSESDNSVRRRKSEDGCSSLRRRISRTSDKSFKVYPPASSSSYDESDDEKEVKNLLSQSRNRLENTIALKIRSHLLRPEDYAEIITTCRDNVRCLDSVIRGTPGTVLSAARSNETRDLLSSWENLLAWSENAAAARKMQEEMVVLKNALSRLGKLSCDFDSESSIQFTIEELKNEKTKLQTYRTNMLRLNASVHSWLTREELKLKRELEANAAEAAAGDDSIANQEKGFQINTIAHSESEFHKHLKDEVSDMYSAWDEADARISNHLEVLTASWIAWRQLECGLSEFHQVLGEDRGTLQGLEGALDKGQSTSVELAQNVKLVAKLLSEKVDCCVRQQQVIISGESTDQGKLLPTAQFNTIVTSSNGSLSDSGISDGGATSDGGLSERERRLGVLRRLAKQLENALAPGSDALRSIAARMEAAEFELKTLQNTCRELIVRTAVSQHTKSQAIISSDNNTTMSIKPPQIKPKKSPPSKRKNKRKLSSSNVVAAASVQSRNQKKTQKQYAVAPDAGDPDDPKDDPWDIYSKNNDDDDDIEKKKGWAWRVARFAFPVQIAILTLFCAACLMEPHCCDSLNNLSMSFTPQLRYVRGPPPI